MTSRLPSLFISHGAPTLALEPGLLGPRLTALGEALPDSVLVAEAVAEPVPEPEREGGQQRRHTGDERRAQTACKPRAERRHRQRG